MAQSSNNRLQFSINESVWLRNDVPAEEILSMALEPDITIEENWSDVTIRGTLRLTGEFKPAEVASPESEERSAPFRIIDQITETTVGTAILEHHFPIDITIPKNRVANLEELYINIDSFDYELSEKRHIQLQADLAITGLSDPGQAEKKAVPSANDAVKAANQDAYAGEAEQRDFGLSKEEQQRETGNSSDSEQQRETGDMAETSVREVSDNVGTAAEEEIEIPSEPASQREVKTQAQPSLEEKNEKPEERTIAKASGGTPEQAPRNESERLSEGRKSESEKYTGAEEGSKKISQTALPRETLAETEGWKEAEKADPSDDVRDTETKEERDENEHIASETSQERASGDRNTDPSDFDEMPTYLQLDETDDEDLPAEFQYAAFRIPEHTEDETEDKIDTPKIALTRMDEEKPETNMANVRTKRETLPNRETPGDAAVPREETVTRGEAPAAAPVPEAEPEKINVPQVEPIIDEANQAVPEEEAAPEEAPSANPEEANSLYLTKVLAGNNEEQRTKVKICIVQNGESLETISDRYKIPVTSLLRKNQLTSGNIEPGQILYIPESAKGIQNE
ncbi:LysM peptidoglycan-binding domain-containing protein [Sporolactobacillus sp. THM7-7]|nr:LysM peptidoglycan-binding domain-containing protein [Sporolactobacillus sp. THM7-7]